MTSQEPVSATADAVERIARVLRVHDGSEFTADEFPTLEDAQQAARDLATLAAYATNAAENARLAQEAEQERDHYRFHFDQQEQRAEAAERERDEQAVQEQETFARLRDALRERDEAREALRRIISDFDDGDKLLGAKQIARAALASPAAEGERYDERTSELDIPGAERGWTGAPAAEAVQALRRLGLTPILPTDDPERGQRMQDDP